MKFWELTSAFRDEKDILDTILNNPKWESYQIKYRNLNKIVLEQNRKILDEEIPYELAFDICTKSNKKFWLYSNKILSSYMMNRHESFQILTASDVLKNFGGHILEETIEKSYTEIE